MECLIFFALGLPSQGIEKINDIQNIFVEVFCFCIVWMTLDWRRKFIALL